MEKFTRCIGESSFALVAYRKGAESTRVKDIFSEDSSRTHAHRSKSFHPAFAEINAFEKNEGYQLYREVEIYSSARARNVSVQNAVTTASDHAV